MTVREKLHKRLYHFCTSYRYAVFFIALILSFSGYSILSQTNTSGIRILNNGTTMACDDRITIYKAENATSFINNLSQYQDVSFKHMICTVDRVYDGSPEDQATLLHFVKNKISFWPLFRKDISEYFIKKIKSDYTTQ